MFSRIHSIDDKERSNRLKIDVGQKYGSYVGFPHSQLENPTGGGVGNVTLNPTITKSGVKFGLTHGANIPSVIHTLISRLLHGQTQFFLSIADCGTR